MREQWNQNDGEVMISHNILRFVCETQREKTKKGKKNKRSKYVLHMNFMWATFENLSDLNAAAVVMCEFALDFASRYVCMRERKSVCVSLNVRICWQIDKCLNWLYVLVVHEMTMRAT